jgi:hypothetical protein
MRDHHAAFEVPYQLTDAEVAPDQFAELGKKIAEAQAAMTELQPTVADWRTVALAREMCRAQGHDPDMMVVDVKGARTGPFGSVGSSNSVPAWTLYLEAAQGLSGALNG